MLIDGRLASIVETVESNIAYFNASFAFYEEEGQVFFYDENQFKLLYDFNLEAGDTLRYDLPWYIQDDIPDSNLVAIIDSIDSIEVEDIILKRLHTRPLYKKDECIDLGIITERIGSEAALIFGRPCYIHAGKVWAYLRCYSDSTLEHNIGYMPCDFLDDKRFAPFGAIWHYEAFSDDCNTRTYFTVEADPGPTNTDYPPRSVQVFYKDSSDPLVTIELRHDFHRIFFREDNVFKLLYDFDLTAGDTMTFHVPRSRHYFDFTCPDSLAVDSEYQVVIDSVSEDEIDGLMLKSLHTSPIGKDCIDLGVINEKYGSEFGLFGRRCSDCSSGCPGHLRCYSDQQIMYMASTEACDYTTSTHEDKLSNDLYLYPNPADQIMHIGGVSASELETINVYDSFGRLRHTQKGGSIEVSDCPAGLYLVEVPFKNNKSYLLRFVKQ
jgi:hypothetical protein